MTIDWLLRVGDGENFKRSSKFGIWGLSSNIPTNKYFLKNVKYGDRLWFVKSRSQGKIIAVATYCSHNKREFGPLIDISLSNEELGWNGNDWSANIEVHYSDLYGLDNCDLYTHIKGPSTIRKYDLKCKVILPQEYIYIVRYSKVRIQIV